VINTQVTEADKHYILELSNKDSFSITGEEKEQIMKARSTFVQLRSGEIINKSFIVAITLDREITRIKLEDKRQKLLEEVEIKK